MKLNLYRIAIAFFFFNFCCNAESKVTLLLNSNENLIEQTIAANILKEIIPSDKFELHIKPVPPSRAHSYNINLISDGEIARISTYGEFNTQLHRVDPPYYYLKSEVFCKKNLNKTFTNKLDLRKYRVAAIRGVAHSDKQLEGHTKIQYAYNAEQMFELLNIERVELVLDTAINGAKILLKKQFANIKPCGTLAKYELHLYLNDKSKKYSDQLSSNISQAIKTQKLPKLWKETEENELNKFRNLNL